MMRKVYSPEYEAYIRSPEWAEVKRRRLLIDGGKCCMCHTPVGDGVKWETHHLHYKTLGHENVLTDVCTLCVDCHKLIHNYYDRIRA